MTDYLFDPAPVKTVTIKGATAAYPINRVFCVGRNYAAHAVEMGAEVDREAPFYFTKAPVHVEPTGATVPYPSGTENYHHEMELAFAIGKPVFRATAQEAAAAILAYGCALDMTRRDMQNVAKEKRRPWDLSKDFENGCILSPMTPAGEVGEIGPHRIQMSVNGEVRQDAHLSDLIHSCPDVVVDLSKYYHLAPGDIILTGTPAGVGAVKPGDVITGSIDGMDPIELTIGAAE